MDPSNSLFQAEQHPLVPDVIRTAEDRCLALIHEKAYATAAKHATGKAVLDVGCNRGYGTKRVSLHAAKVIGVDVSPTSVGEAQKRYPDLEFRIVDGSSLPFEDASFDMVTFFQVIEHVAAPGPFLREVIRVLRPDGLALLTTPNGTHRLDPGMQPWNRFHVREYGTRELADELAPYFAEVELLGLQGPSDFERTERGRTRRLRRRARRRNRWPAGRWVNRFARRVDPLRSWLRDLGAGEAASRWGLSELRWEPAVDARAVDLLALCRRPRVGAGGAGES